MNQLDLVSLQQAYKGSFLVPFIGAGMSVPLGLQSWGGLVKQLNKDIMTSDHYKAIVDDDIERKQYMQALENIKKYSTISDSEIQLAVSRYLNNGKTTNNDNNLVDIAQNNFPLILTTNYDDLLEDACKHEDKVFSSIKQLWKYSNYQDLITDEKGKIIHIHGSIDKPDSIILTNEQYKRVYEDKRYMAMIGSLLGTKKIIFMGFSFDDPYVKEMFKYYSKIFNSIHYILFPEGSMTLSEAKSLKEEYGLEAIFYDCTDNNHVSGIRTVLQNICQPHLVSDNTKNQNIEVAWSSDSLFFRKLKLAGVKSSLRDLAVDFYKNSELFIREVKGLGFSQAQIERVLAQVFMEYKDDYVTIYEESHDSDELVVRVHEDLKQLNLGRLVTKQTKPSDTEMPGLVHVLADDNSKNVWWGDDRFE